VQGQIDWGPTEALGNTTNGNTTNDHAIPITGLQPDHFYWYRVLLQGVPVTPIHRTRTFASATSTPAGSDVTFFVFGDCGTGSSDQIRVANLVHSWDWDLGLLPGDIIYPDGQASGFDPYFFTPYGQTLRSTPFYPVLGNHDNHTSERPRVSRCLPPALLQLGHRTLVFLRPRQRPLHRARFQQKTSRGRRRGLRNDLMAARSNNAQWIFVTLHHPAYSSGAAMAATRRCIRTGVRSSRSSRVDAVFTGHDHI
jgi:hypothetical protein